MRYSSVFMPLLFVLLLTTFAAVSDSQAGPHAGGTLIVHSENLVYSVGDVYCDTMPPSSCASVGTRVDVSGPSVWVVYGAFLDAETPRLRGIEFGVRYSPGIEIVAHGSCADLEQSLPGWPASGSGTVIVWFDNQVGQLIPAYWFAGYAASAGGSVSFEVGPHPQNGGHFGDDSIIPVADEIAGYGVLGFGAEGSAPCPRIRTFTIRADGTGDVPTISDALRIAAAGSVIQLEDGIYRGPGNRDLEFNHTPLTLRSISGDPEACIIDCEGRPGESHRGVRIGWMEDTQSLVAGIKFINGFVGPELDPDVEGGAIKVDTGGSLRIVDCIFENCIASNSGGAIDAGGVSVVIENCIFSANRSTGYGGGGFSGGGNIAIKNCLFENNSAPVEAGGAWITNGTLVMENCKFVRNRAAFGGGMVSYGIVGTVRGTTWFDNHATQSGGGLYCREGALVVEESTFSDNSGPRGASVATRASGSTDLVLRRSIIAFSEGNSAIYCGTGGIELRNCDLWESTGEWFSGCLIDPWAERGNFSADPLFCDRFAGDLTLREDSPCVTQDDFGRDPIGAWPIGCAVRDAAEGGFSIAEKAQREKASAGDGEAEAGTLLQHPSAEPSMQASPNPFRSGTTIDLSVPGPSSSPIGVEIFDLSGRLVRRLEGSARASGEYRIAWDGRDDAGRDSPVGTYFSRASLGPMTLSLRIVRVP